MRKTEEDQGAKLVRCATGIALGGAAALLACFLFLLIVSAGISKGMIGERFTYQITVVGCVLGTFVGASLAVRRCGERSLLVSLAVGAVLFLLLLTIGVAFLSASLEAGGVGLLCGCLCGGAAAGLLWGRPQKGGSRGKKKRRK